MLGCSLTSKFVSDTLKPILHVINGIFMGFDPCGMLVLHVIICKNDSSSTRWLKLDFLSIIWKDRQVVVSLYLYHLLKKKANNTTILHSCASQLSRGSCLCCLLPVLTLVRFLLQMCYAHLKKHSGRASRENVSFDVHPTIVGVLCLMVPPYVTSSLPCVCTHTPPLSSQT